MKRFVRQIGSTAGGFTLVELMVVISIIVVLVAMLVPSMEKSLALARRAVCASRGHAIMLSIQHYGSDNRQDVPAHTGHVGNWLWDVNADSVRSLLRYTAAGESQRELFHCPSNIAASYEEEWLNGSRESATDPDGAGPGTGVLVLTFHWTMLRPTGPGYVGALSGNQLDATDNSRYYNGHVPRAKLTEAGQVTRTPLIVDSVMFDKNQLRWSDLDYEGRKFGSSHMEGDRKDGLPIPAGGNLSFIDGHVDWKDLSDMTMNFDFDVPNYYW